MWYSVQIMKLKCEENVPLSKYCTLGTGGFARFFFRAKNKQDVIDGLKFAKSKKLPVFVLGEGSNVVIDDNGFHGLVLKIEITGMEFENDGQAKVGAGVSWDKFVKEAVNKNFSGIECLSAIPGTVGTAPVQNIGAYGTEISNVIKEIHTIDRETFKEAIFQKEECAFGYRKSIFNSSKKNRYVITKVIFALIPKGTANVSYQDLINYFGDKKPTLKEPRDGIMEIRTKKGHVAPPNGPRSVGSFFKNLIVKKEKFEEIKNKIKNQSGNWFWPQEDGTIKISAARLIEESGFEKGLRFGNVGISPFHSLVLVTYDGATSTELMVLAKKIQGKIKNRFNIQLDIEPETLI